MACSECDERVARMAAYIEELRGLREAELAAAERLRGEVEGARARLLGILGAADDTEAMSLQDLVDALEAINR